MLSLTAWPLITHFGNSVLLLSTAIAIGGWLVAGRAWRYCVIWLATLAVAVLAVLASKLAFLGWGIGIASLDFTGISGHAMLSSAVIPTLAALLTMRQSFGVRAAAIFIGVGAALLVGVSRLMLHAHSPSEVFAGWATGALVAFPSIGLFYRASSVIRPALSATPIVIVLTLLLALTAPLNGRPSFETHALIIKMALWGSGRAEPFARTGRT